MALTAAVVAVVVMAAAAMEEDLSRNLKIGARTLDTFFASFLPLYNTAV